MTDPATLRINILGPLECWCGGTRLRLGGPIPERVLVALLLEPGQVLPVSRLVEVVWNDDPPTTASHQVRKAVARLRQVLPEGAGLIVTDGPGYRAELGSVELDLDSFTRSLEAARQAATGRAQDAMRHLESALALWRGPVLGGTGGAIIDAASTVLEERRLAAVEQLMELRLAGGEASELVGDLRRLAAAHPLREVLRGQLMRALFRAGRQAEALDEYARVRRTLSDELGIDPGAELAQLHEAMLRNDPSLAAPKPVRPAVPFADVPIPVASFTLPYDLRDFTGRKTELASLLRYAEQSSAHGPRIVAIDGMGGSGKTSLAVHAAHLLAERYPDAQLYLDLRGFSPDEEPLPIGSVAEALLRMLGTPGDRIPDRPDDRVALWRAIAARHPLLLLLDNARGSGQVLPLLPPTAQSLVIVTSRVRLMDLDGAHRISLGEMSSGDSIELVTETLGKERVAAEPDAAAELVKLCGHLPLALRIAAARLGHRPRWTIEYLVDRMRNEDRRLDELRSEERSVRVTLTLSYQGLDAKHRAALRILGNHPGRGIDVHSAAALLETSTDAAEEIMENLLDTHLMQQHQIGYYAFHDLVRSFAHELGSHAADPDAGPHGADAVRRLLDYYVTATDEACDLLFPGRARLSTELARSTAELPSMDDSGRARRWLHSEQHSLRGAIHLAHSAQLYQHATDLARNVVFHLDSHGQFEEFHEVAAAAVDAARQLGDQVRLRLSLSNLAVANWRLGRLDEGISAATEGLRIAVELGDPRGEAKDLGLRGLLLATLGRFDDALPLLERSIALKRELGAVRAEAESLSNLSSLYEQWGHFAEAAEAAWQAVELNRGLGSRENEIVALADYAAASRSLGALDQADDCLRQARVLIDDDSSPGDHALVCALSATVCRELDRPDEADQHAERALELSRSSRAPLRQIEVENIIGALRRAEGNPAAALELHDGVRGKAAAIGYRVEEARALLGLARAYDALGEHGPGAEFGARAETLFTELGIPAAAWRHRD